MHLHYNGRFGKLFDFYADLPAGLLPLTAYVRAALPTDL